MTKSSLDKFAPLFFSLPPNPWIHLNNEVADVLARHTDFRLLPLLVPVTDQMRQNSGTVVGDLNALAEIVQ